MDFFQRVLLPQLREFLSLPLDGFEYALVQGLEDSKPRFLVFFDLPPPSPSERKDVESGSIQSHTGVTFFSASFRDAVLSLSSELNASERYCASLLEHALSEPTQPITPATVQAALLVRLKEQSAFLQCIRLLIETAARSDARNSRTLDFLRRYVYDIVKGPYSGNTVQNLPMRLILQIDAAQDSKVILQNRASSSDEQTGEWLSTRVQILQEQRRQLGHILYLVAGSGQLSSEDITSLVKWLSKVKDMSDGLPAYILTSIFASICPPLDENADEDVSPVFCDPQLFVDISAALNTPWLNSDLKSAVMLQYSLYHLEVRSRDTHVRGEISVIEDEVGASLKKAVTAGAFQALTRILLRTRGTCPMHDRPDYVLGADNSIIPGRAVHQDLAELDGALPTDFRAYLLNSIDNLVISLIRRLSRTLRDIRKQEEDRVHVARGNRNLQPYNASIASDTTSVDNPPSNIESFFRLIAVLYDEQPLDAGLRYWTDEGGRLFPFLRWAGESRQPGAVSGMLDMVASLARGSSCATYAYNFLSTGGGHYASGIEEGAYSTSNPCSWSTLFMALHHYENRLPTPQIPVAQGISPHVSQNLPLAPAGTAISTARFSLPLSELLMLGSFLRVLRNVSKFSSVARLALHENRDFRAIQTLFNLSARSIPLELKAMLFDALSAFAAPGGGSAGLGLVQQMWEILERMEMIPVRNTVPNVMLSGRSGRPSGGAVIELDVIESTGKTYPATLALVQLLNSLIHTPQKALSLRNGFEVESKTIPATLGKDYRVPGLKPYVDFVIDNVFTKAFEREYSYPDEQWQLLEACLCFIEKSLVSFDLWTLSGLEFATWKSGNPIEQKKAMATLASLASHPGFFAMKRILGHSHVRENLLYVVDKGFPDALQKLDTSYSRSKTVLRSLRIMDRILQIQGLYAEVLLPLLQEVGEIPKIGAVGFSSSILVPLDAAILQNPHIVPNIAVYVSLPDPKIALFAVNILSGLSDHPNFNWGPSLDPMVTSLRASRDWDRILAGFVMWIEAEGSSNLEDVSGTADAPDEDLETGSSVSCSVQVAIVRFLLHNTKVGRPSPNVAHLLLGLHRTSSPEIIIEEGSTSNSSSMCLRSILGLLSQGLVAAQPSGNVKPLSQSNPILAEMCFQLVQQLCVHGFSSKAVIRYLRSRDQFFERQLSGLPVRVPVLRGAVAGRATYSDGAEVQTTATALTSCLRLQSSILQSVALELRVLAATSQHGRLERLVGLLFEVSSGMGTSRFENADDAFPGQQLMRILHVFERSAATWDDLQPIQPVPLQMLRDVHWESALRPDDYGCSIYDLRMLIALLRGARSRIHYAGTLSASEIQQLRAETEFVLRSATTENTRREIEHSVAQGLTSWAAVLDVALTTGFDFIPSSRREAILHDLLTALPTRIANSPPSTAAVLSSSFLLIINKLREAISRHSLIFHTPSSTLSSERLQIHLKNTLEMLVRQDLAEKTRGNLYASLGCYLQIVHEFDESDTNDLRTSAFVQNLNLNVSAKRSALLVDTISILTLIADRLIPVICNDAIDGSEVWKTVAFTLLAALVNLTQLERSQHILSVLVKRGYLQTIVDSLRASNLELIQVLNPNTFSLNALYVYEAKMTFLLRLSQSRTGAERLVECRVFSGLAQVDVLDSRPYDDSNEDSNSNSFLPTIYERYNQILSPALDLVASVLSTIGQSIPAVVRQGGHFLMAHRDTFTGILTDRPQTLTYAAVRQLQLVVAICAMTLPHVEAESDAYRPFHLAILSVGAIFLNLDSRGTHLQVAGQSEDTSLLNLPELLKHWIIVYLTGAVNLDGHFTPTLIVDESQHRGGRDVPTLSDAIAALTSEVRQLQASSHSCEDIALKIGMAGQLAPEELDQVLGAGTLSGFSLAERRSASSHVLTKLYNRNTRTGFEHLHCIELLLFLVYSHLDGYFHADQSDSSSQKTAPTRSLMSSWAIESNGGMGTLRERTAAAILPTLITLQDIHFESFSSDEASTARKVFIGVIAKRIREVLVHVTK